MNVRISGLRAAGLVAATTFAFQSASGVTLSGNTSVQHQTMTGWEATAEVGLYDAQDRLDSPVFALYKDELFDRAIDELGINRIRLEIRSSAEHTTDNWSAYRAGTINQTTWRDRRYQSVNDNALASSSNAAGFQFAEFDHKIENVLNPLRQRMVDRGKDLFVNLTFVDFNTSTDTAFEHRTDPQEYAELMSVTFNHMKDKYGWTPNQIEMVLEPDNTKFTAKQVADALVATGDRLLAEGFTPKFAAPSNERLTNSSGGKVGANQFYADMKSATLGNPRVLEYLDEFVYHRYQGTIANSTLTSMATTAKTDGVKTAMLEHGDANSTYLNLHQDLKFGNVSAWQQYALAYPTTDNGFQYYTIDQSNPSDPQVNMGSRTKYLRHYFKHVDMGAVRIDGSSSGTGSSAFDPLFFINPGGDWAVIVKQTDDGQIDINGLPAGTYTVEFTGTNSLNQFVDSALEITITEGQTLSYFSPVVAGVSSVSLVPEPSVGALLAGVALLLTRRRKST